MKNKASLWATGSILGLAMLAPAIAAADSGFYLGGSVGSASVDADLGVELPILPEFDETDTGYKLFAGYNWQLSALALGIEGAYNNFGNPSTNFGIIPIAIEPTGYSVFGVAALGLGPIDLFAKAGVLAWDADAIIDGEVSTEDGSDPGYGVGLRFNIGSLQIRGEYEVFDVDEADLSMLSVGLAFQF